MINSKNNETDKIDDREDVLRLLSNIKAALPRLAELFEQCSGKWGYEDPVYRFYHQSNKVYRLQDATLEIVSALKTLAPDRPLNKWFLQIVKSGTGKEFDLTHNRRWLKITRTIVEAFFHARYFLEMAIKYGKEFEQPPQVMPSGWAAILHLYNLR